MKQGASTLLLWAAVWSCSRGTDAMPGQDEMCHFATMPRMSDVEMNRMLGAWYQVRTAPWTGSDVSLIFYRSEADGQLMAIESGRYPNETECNVYYYTVTGSDGLYLAQDVDEPSYKEQLLVIASDYDTYFIVYACLQQDANGGCTTFLASLFTRTAERILSPENEALVTRTFREICLKPEDFQYTVKTGEECMPSEWK